AGRVTRAGAAELAHSGSLSPCPVTVQTIVEPRGTRPAAADWSSPATLAALASSTKIPTRRASSRYALRMSRSVTAWMSPSDWSRASTAFAHEAGLPMRIAVAIVVGSVTTERRTIGAAPDGWQAHVLVRRVGSPRLNG